jgi:hypothetical protein
LRTGQRWSWAIKDRFTGALIIQLCQMQALRASSRWTILAQVCGVEPAQRRAV